MIDAILFDFGGVFTASPFTAVRDFAVGAGIDPDLAVEVCFGSYDVDGDHPWHQLERGEVALEEAHRRIVALGRDAGFDLDPLRALASMAGDDPEREIVVERVRALRTDGYRTAVVTNNVVEFGDGWKRLVPVDELFDVVVDSSVIGARKPSRRIFDHALDALGGVAPERAVLLDDASGNVAAARSFGLHAILVGPRRVEALDELDVLLGR